MTGFYNICFLGMVSVFFIAWPDRVLSVYQPEAAIIPYGTACLRVISYGYLFYAYGMVIVQAFNGAGDTMTPTVINLFCYWCWQIPLAWWLAMPREMGPTGVFLAITIEQSTIAVVGALTYRGGPWKLQRI